MEMEIESILRGRMFKLLLEQQMEEICSNYGFRRVDIDVLNYLRCNTKANTAKDIQNSLKINKGYVSQILDNLCKQGYVKAIQDQKDRRYIHYVLTDKTDEVAEEIKLILKKMREKIFEGISGEEQEAFKKTALKIKANIMMMLGE